MIFKILPDGQLLIERGDNIDNEKMFELLETYVSDKEKLRNFLFQWKDRRIICGMSDLCG